MSNNTGQNNHSSSALHLLNALDWPRFPWSANRRWNLASDFDDVATRSACSDWSDDKFQIYRKRIRARQDQRRNRPVRRAEGRRDEWDPEWNWTTTDPIDHWSNWNEKSNSISVLNCERRADSTERWCRWRTANETILPYHLDFHWREKPIWRRRIDEFRLSSRFDLLLQRPRFGFGCFAEIFQREWSFFASRMRTS